MKKMFLLLFVTTAFSAFAQRLSTVGILPFEASGDGVSEVDAEEATRLVAAELGSWGTLTVLLGEAAESAEYTVRGEVSRQNNQTVLTATTFDTRTGKPLNDSREHGAALGAIPMVTFCAQVAENVPYPNYLLGKWRSTVTMIDGPLTCVMEFRPDRSVLVERFDTWEHSGTNSLKYQAIGRGTYSYAGFLRRAVTVGGRQVRTDATVGMNLTLEDALPKYSSVRLGGQRVLFDDSRSSFEILGGGIPCGDNKSGPSVYPGANVYYTHFTKID